MSNSKDMIGSETKMTNFGGVEPTTSIFEKNFWKIGGIAAVGYSYGRVGIMVGLLGIGWAGWREYQYDWIVANRPVQVFVGEKDANGIIRPMFGADRPYTPEHATIEAFLRQWIKQARWISPDKVMMADFRNDIFNRLDDEPNAQLNAYYELNNPDRMADQKISRSIEPLGASLISPNSNTYRLDWIEYQIEGAQALVPVRRTGNFIIVHRAPEDQEEFNRNPSGLWITHVDSEVFRIPAGAVAP